MYIDGDSFEIIRSVIIILLFDRVVWCRILYLERKHVDLDDIVKDDLEE